MKTLQKGEMRLYRFRCDHCRSKFEMTEEEKFQNDIQFDDEWDKKVQNQEKYGWKATPNNLLNHFNCPVCDCIRYVRRNEMHCFVIMDDGTEVMDY